ncbi:MAG: LamG-like jellyroll fold domain-containing protein, partial [Candidatus Micrarchaeia archaeon]
IASCYSPTIYVTPQGYLAGGDSSTGSFAFNTNYFVADNKWHFVVVNQTTTQQTLFLDGVEIGTVPITPQTCIPDNWSIGAGTVNNQISYFNGSIANVQMYSTSLNFGQVRQLYQEGIAGLPISNAGLVAWYPLGGDANDYSGNGNNGAIYGNLNMLQIQQSPSGNYSNVVTATFNPNGASTPDAFINIPSIVPVNYSRFSYFAWIKPTYTESYSRVLATSSGDRGAIEIATGGATQIMINGYNTTGWLGVNSYFPLNTWNLVGATYNGTTYIVYLNGKQVWSRKVGKLFGYAAPGNLQIGLTTAYPPSGNQFFGNIANVQFYSTNLTASEVAQLYQGGVFGLPLARGLVAWYPLLGNANDYSGNGNNGVSYNVTYTLQSIASPYLLYSFGGSGVEFNGQNSYIYNSSYAPLNLQPNFTIAAMVYLNSYANSPMIYSEGNPALTLGLGINSNGNLYAQVWNAKTTNNWIGFTSNLKVPLHTWTFVALSLNNGGIATGNAALYMNTQNQTFSLQEENNSGTHYLGIGFNIGYLVSQPFQGINGSIANLQIYNKALTPKQINELYNNLYPAYASKEVSMGVLP